jgi:transcriptional regulator with XRE-family HTH domain
MLSREKIRAGPLELAVTMGWSGRIAVGTVLPVPGSAEDENAYLRRLGRTIECLRKAREWTQEQFAERLGRDKNTVSRWENGKTSISAYDLVLLANTLGASVDESLPPEWLMEPTDSVTELDVRTAQLRRAAAEAARRDAEDGHGPPGDDAPTVRRGRPRA